MSIVLIVVAVAGLAWFFLTGNGSSQRPRSSTNKKSKSKISTPTSKYASVALHCGHGACKPAIDMGGMAILATEAPVLPLAGCDAQNCTCSYEKTVDRRQETGRRTADHGIQPLIFDGPEHREPSDRRDVK